MRHRCWRRACASRPTPWTSSATASDASVSSRSPTTTPSSSTSCCRSWTAWRCAATLRASGSHVPVLMLTASDSGRGADRGARQRRRRLPDQAVRLRRAAGAAARRHPARPAAADAGRLTGRPLAIDTRARRAFRRRRGSRSPTREYALARVSGAARRTKSWAAPRSRNTCGTDRRSDVERHRRLHPAPPPEDRRSGAGFDHPDPTR